MTIIRRRSGWRSCLAACLLSTCIIFSGCTAESTISPVAAATASAEEALAGEALAGEALAGEALGEITVLFDKPKKKKYKRIAKSLEESGAYQQLAERLTETYKLPVDLPIRFTELGEENAYFDPNTNEITVGYELIDAYSQIFEIDKKDPEAYQQELVDAGYFTVCHEVGHALVALFEIPITGSEEDAVDEFATLLLLKMNDEQAESALISGIEQFSVDAAASESLEDLSFTAEHSFDKQRFYDVLSLVYGSDPDYHSDLISEDYLPEEMAEDSVAEYERKSAVWDRLLAEHLRDPKPSEEDVEDISEEDAAE